MENLTCVGYHNPPEPLPRAAGRTVMSEIMVWSVVVGAAAALAAIAMLYTQVEYETHSGFDAIVHRVMERLKEQIPTQPRTAPQRKGPGAQHNHRAVRAERRTFPRRRIDDLFPSRKLKRIGT